MNVRQLIEQFTIGVFSGGMGGLIVYVATELSKDPSHSHALSYLYALIPVGLIFFGFLYLFFVEKKRNQTDIENIMFILLWLFFVTLPIYLSLRLY
jgi:hypothetical protein